jgi:hypothetical protein
MERGGAGDATGATIPFAVPRVLFVALRVNPPLPTCALPSPATAMKTSAALGAFP